MTVLRRGLRRVTRRSPVPAEEGFALLGVLASMALVTVMLLGTLAYAAGNAAPSRSDQDSKAAIAAAQAGIEEYVARLNVDDTYYTNNGVDASNPAFGSGVSVQGSDGLAASYSYRLLTTAEQTAQTGLIRLRVTGRSKGVSRELTASLRPDGFLKYLYLTDLEVGDPVLYDADLRVAVNGVYTRSEYPSTGDVKRIDYHYFATPAMVHQVCSEYYYVGRHARVYSTGQYVEVGQGYKANGTKAGAATTTTLTASSSNKITLDCREISFTGTDTVDGPLHTNDAVQLTGAAVFTQRTSSSWGSNPATSTTGIAPMAAPTDGKLWWNNKTVDPPQQEPVTAPLVRMPESNDVLLRKANPLAPDNGPGCVYTGQTVITFVDDKMKVRSPGTTSSVPRCFDTTQRDAEQTLAIPPVIYVKSGPCGTVNATNYPYPMALEDTGPTRWTTTYDCSYGTAFVSGQLSGRVTIATSHDVVVVGNTTYKDGLTGSDALGLIPQGFAWVYHPINKNDGKHLLPESAWVRKIDAAILSVQHSFTVQNFDRGESPLSTTSDPESRLRVRGSMVQKFRGPVSKMSDNKGYIKNYIYDARLLHSPPPYFLRPLTSPWKVVKVTA